VEELGVVGAEALLVDPLALLVEDLERHRDVRHDAAGRRLPRDDLEVMGLALGRLAEAKLAAAALEPALGRLDDVGHLPGALDLVAALGADLLLDRPVLGRHPFGDGRRPVCGLGASRRRSRASCG